MFIKFIICISICEFVGLSGAIFTKRALPNWYVALTKPSFNPPDWIFGPVWITLYLLMGIALFLIIKDGFVSGEIIVAASFFAVQLLLNGLWSYIFFGKKALFLSLIDLILLWILILVTAIMFYKINNISGYLMIPYLLWVSFAGILNWSIWKLN